MDDPHIDPVAALMAAIARDDLEEVRKLVLAEPKILHRRSTAGSAPLSNAALHGRLKIVEFLIEQGAKVSAANTDGNTPLHVAAFLCRLEVVDMLLEKGAPPGKRSRRGERPIDVVSAPWSPGLARFYGSIGQATGLDLDLDRIKRDRPRVAKILRERAAK